VEWPSVRTICIRLERESLDVTLSYLKGKDAESEEAPGTYQQKQPGPLRLKTKNITTRDFWLAWPEISRSRL
jgi:hypothetical protein